MLHLPGTVEQEVCQSTRWKPRTSADHVRRCGAGRVNSMNAVTRSPWAAAAVAVLAVALGTAVGPVLAEAEEAGARCGGNRPRAFWDELERNGFAVPAGESSAALLEELEPCLASPDPKLRDELEYNAAAAWIYRDKRLSDAEVRRQIATWVANLRRGIGESGTDSVFRRSFSALNLSIVAALDNARPFLERSEFESLLRAALDYLAAEKDVRGFDVEKGWIHSAAHTADLLKFLGRSRHLTAAEQPLVLDAIAAKLDAVGLVFTHGENERLARAVASLARRADLDTTAFARWLS